MEKELGIVIGSIDYSESSKIVYLYTENGKKSVMVLGAKKYKNNLLAFTTTLNLIKFEATNKKLPKLISYDLINSFPSIKNDFRKVFCCELIIEILFSIDDSFSKNIFSFIKKIFDNISNYDFSFLFLDMFLVKMLKIYGVNPTFKVCSVCGSVEKLFSFSIKEGGILCENCKGRKDIDDNIAASFSYLYNIDIDKLDFEKLNSLFDYEKAYKALKSYYDFHVDKHFKAFLLIEKIIK